MTAYEFMQKQLRGVADGIAWAQHVFTGSRRFAPGELVDAAVDIAWERLMPKTLERPKLEIEKRKRLIVFRIGEYAIDQAFAQAA